MTVGKGLIRPSFNQGSEAYPPVSKAELRINGFQIRAIPDSNFPEAGWRGL